MKLLSIETSCDETAIALVSTTEGYEDKTGVYFDVHANLIHSQVDIHKEYGGVFPSLAKREHAKNLIPLLKKVIHGFSESKIKHRKLLGEDHTALEQVFEKEPGLLEQFLKEVPKINRPDIDAIAVTYGPGLEPALWVGINFAKALALVWNVPIIPINHMEGHIFSAILKKISNSQFLISKIDFPVLALLISGGHTELVLMRNWLEYEIVGQTRDDAVGEAFDKVARMLGLPYPGGPEIARHAKKYGGHPMSPIVGLPRPMINSDDLDFSFSGLKTAVLYRLKKVSKITPAIIREFSYEFQQAATEVLVSKTLRAAKKYGVATILVGGGVSANEYIKTTLTNAVAGELPETTLHIAPRELTGDNALMIAVAGFMRAQLKPETLITPTLGSLQALKANGNLRLK